MEKTCSRTVKTMALITVIASAVWTVIMAVFCVIQRSGILRTELYIRPILSVRVIADGIAALLFIVSGTAMLRGKLVNAPFVISALALGILRVISLFAWNIQEKAVSMLDSSVVIYYGNLIPWLYSALHYALYAAAVISLVGAAVYSYERGEAAEGVCPKQSKNMAVASTVIVGLWAAVCILILIFGNYERKAGITLPYDLFTELIGAVIFVVINTAMIKGKSGKNLLLLSVVTFVLVPAASYIAEELYSKFHEGSMEFFLLHNRLSNASFVLDVSAGITISAAAVYAYSNKKQLKENNFKTSND